MLARNETIFKWILYTLAAVLCLFVQGALLQRITLWGVIPFVYPLVAVIPATYEDTPFGAAFTLCVGITCDLILPDVFPCLYTLIFPLAALCASAFSRSLMRAGFLCSLLSSAAAFFLLDFFRCQCAAEVRRVFVVHGEPEAAESLGEGLREAGFGNVAVPVRGQVFEL